MGVLLADLPSRGRARHQISVGEGLEGAREGIYGPRPKGIRLCIMDLSRQLCSRRRAPPDFYAVAARRSAQQLARRPDDREIDPAPAVSRLGRVVHIDAAEVELAHVGERFENLLACGLRAGALERRDGDLADDEALERGDRKST